MSEQAVRLEHDSMGEVRVPADAKWQAQTQRAVENFPISGVRLERSHIGALALIKGVAATVNARLGVLDAELGAAIAEAAAEVAAGRWDAHFPIDVFQTGSGTSSNMNANEVVATLAAERLGRPVHPNDHVNASQSSNDVFPSSIHIAAVAGVTGELIPALDRLGAALGAKAEEFAEVVKAGRTHLMDATPVTLGQEFGGYAAQVRRGVERLESTLPRLAELPLGGTAVGTGLNTPASFGADVAAELDRMTGLGFVTAPNKFAALAAHDAIVRAHGALKALAAALTKIANDVRWLASGPRSGLGELQIPENEPGSSIMPGKVNPTQCEAMTMLCCQVIGNDVAVSMAGASGNFELNVYKPVMIHNLLQSVRLLDDGMRGFDKHCAQGIEPRRDRIAELLQNSLMLVTALNPHIGYDAAAQIARTAHAKGLKLRDAAIASGKLTGEQFDAWVRAEDMVRPG